MQKFGDLVNIKTGRLDANAADVDGIYPFFTCAVKPLKINTFAYDCECSLVAGNGDLNVKYYKGKFNAYQRVYIIESKDKSIFDTKYQTIFLDTCLRSLRNKTKGAVIQFIRLGDLTGLKLFLPSLEDQLHIANLLSKAETLISQRKESIRLLDQYLKSTYLEMFGEPVLNTKKWELAKLEKISDVGSSKRVFVEELVENGIPFFRGTEIGKLAEGIEIIPTLFITKEHFEELKAHTGIPKIGDLLMPSICPDGRVFRVNNTNSFYFKDGRVLWVKPNQNIINSIYLHFTLKHLFITNYNKIASGTTFAELKIVALKKIFVPCPPFSLQTQFAQIVEKTEALKAQYQQSLLELENLYGSLSQKAFKGELTIKEEFLSQAAEPSMEYKKSEKF